MWSFVSFSLAAYICGPWQDLCFIKSRIYIMTYQAHLFPSHRSRFYWQTNKKQRHTLIKQNSAMRACKSLIQPVNRQKENANKCQLNLEIREEPASNAVEKVLTEIFTTWKVYKMGLWHSNFHRGLLLNIIRIGKSLELMLKTLSYSFQSKYHVSTLGLVLVKCRREHSLMFLPCDLTNIYPV